MYTDVPRFSPGTNSQKSGTHESEVFQSNETTVCLSEILDIIKLYLHNNILSQWYQLTKKVDVSC